MFARLMSCCKCRTGERSAKAAAHSDVVTATAGRTKRTAGRPIRRRRAAVFAYTHARVRPWGLGTSLRTRAQIQGDQRLLPAIDSALWRAWAASGSRPNRAAAVRGGPYVLCRSGPYINDHGDASLCVMPTPTVVSSELAVGPKLPYLPRACPTLRPPAQHDLPPRETVHELLAHPLDDAVGVAGRGTLQGVLEQGVGRFVLDQVNQAAGLLMVQGRLCQAVQALGVQQALGVLG